jgi:hypothetical protein
MLARLSTESFTSPLARTANFELIKMENACRPFNLRMLPFSFRASIQKKTVFVDVDGAFTNLPSWLISQQSLRFTFGDPTCAKPLQENKQRHNTRRIVADIAQKY